MTENAQNSKLRAMIVALSLAFILFFQFLPAPAGMTQPAMQVLGIFAGVLLLWMTISIDWPSMLCILAIAFVPGMQLNKILASTVGSSTFSFLLFTFMCTYTLSQTSFIRRCAIAFVSSPIARRGPWAFMVLYFAATLFLGAFMSPTVLVIVMLTITEEIYAVFGLQKGSKVANMMMMGMVFCSGIAAGMTPIAHVFPLLSMGVYQAAAGKSINHAAYMAAGIPVALISTALMVLVFRFLMRPDMNEIQNLDISKLKNALKPMDRKEITVLTIFYLVVALWVLPGLVESFAPAFAKYVNSFGTAAPPLLGAVAMSVITHEGKPLLNFKDATSKGIPWASLIMTAGTLTIGSAMTNPEIGLMAWVTSSIGPFAKTLSPMLLVLFFAFWAAIQTNLSSNMVTATVVATIAYPIAIAAGSAVSTPALISVIGMMSAYAFATPPAMATVVFAIGSGWTTTGSVAKYGFTLMFISALVAAFVGYPIAAALM